MESGQDEGIHIRTTLSLFCCFYFPLQYSLYMRSHISPSLPLSSQSPCPHGRCGQRMNAKSCSRIRQYQISTQTHTVIKRVPHCGPRKYRGAIWSWRCGFHNVGKLPVNHQRASSTPPSAVEPPTNKKNSVRVSGAASDQSKQQHQNDPNDAGPFAPPPMKKFPSTHFFCPDVKRPHVREAKPFRHVGHGGDLFASSVDQCELYVRKAYRKREPGQPSPRAHVQNFNKHFFLSRNVGGWVYVCVGGRAYVGVGVEGST